jgi:mRNA-degrading endonuclease RelE of RelBE toxin-antitoxin system
MKITHGAQFARALKRLHKNEKRALDKAVMAIATNPELGDAKVGDLTGISVYKFKANQSQWLLAYRIVSRNEITLLVIGPHENFYRDLKKSDQ